MYTGEVVCFGESLHASMVPKMLNTFKMASFSHLREFKASNKSSTDYT